MNEPAIISSQQIVTQRSVEEMLHRSSLIREVMERIMKDGQHYGIIPGTSKPTLYQPGAQLLCVTFVLAPSFHHELRELPNGHREYITTCTLRNSAGVAVAEGSGSCSTMESKYRWRNDRSAGAVVTGHLCPRNYWTVKKESGPEKALSMLRGIMDDPIGKYGAGKFDKDGKPVAKGQEGGEWMILKYPEESAKVENSDIADTYNTVLKMSAKRGFVAATLNATAASDVFTQDLEDLQGNLSAIGADPHEHVRSPQQPAPLSTPSSEPSKPVASPVESARGTPVNTWRDCMVHIDGAKCFGRKLGTLSADTIKAILENWIPGASKEDKKLWAALLLAKEDMAIPIDGKFVGTLCSVCGGKQRKSPSGVTCANGHGGAPPLEIGEKTEEEKAKEQPAKPEDAVPDYDADKIKLIREKLKNAVCTESDFIAKCIKAQQLPGTVTGDLESDTISSEMLDHLLENFDILMKRFGNVSAVADAEPVKAKTAPRRRSTRK